MTEEYKTMKEINIKEYPYEMYCADCKKALAYINYLPEDGSMVLSKGVINFDGTFPQPGEKIPPCACFERSNNFKARPRVVQKLSKCCNTPLVGGVQCENCGSDGK